MIVFSALTLNKMSRLDGALGKMSLEMHNITINTMQYNMFNGPISYTPVLDVKSDVSIQLADIPFNKCSMNLYPIQKKFSTCSMSQYLIQ